LLTGQTEMAPANQVPNATGSTFLRCLPKPPKPERVISPPMVGPLMSPPVSLRYKSPTRPRVPMLTSEGPNPAYWTKSDTRRPEEE